MPNYRTGLPQMGGRPFLTDGGIETTLVFQGGLDLPDFAAFPLLEDANGLATLRSYFQSYAALASRLQMGLILESATWRASADWGARLGYSRGRLADANRKAIHLLEQIRGAMECARPVVISGCVGPRGDGYVAANVMSAEEAEAYHREQIETFAATEADMVCAMTMNYAEEAVGIARAARGAGMPVAISFTVETDGRLPTGQSLGDAIAEVDEETSGFPGYFMLNCAHPSHFHDVLEPGKAWTQRIRGLRANASRKSHAELNESVELDAGDADELAAAYAELRRSRLPFLSILGGCCGTDHRHVERIAAACAGEFH